MSRTHCNYQRNGIKGSSYTMAHKLYKKYVNEINEKSLETIFDMTWKGHKFNVLPFLISGLSFLPVSNYSQLEVLALSNNDGNYVEDSSFFFENEKVDFNIIKSLMPHYEGYSEVLLGIWCYTQTPVQMTKLLFSAFNGVLSDIAESDSLGRITFNYKDIANTQSFCYHIGAYWVMQNSPVLRTIIKSEVNKFNIEDVIKESCPDGCLLDKFLCGEITSEEMFNQYVEPSFPDGSSIADREVMCLIDDDSKYDGRDLTESELGLCEDVLNLIHKGLVFAINKEIGYAYLKGDAFKQYKSICEDASKEIEALDKKLRVQYQKYNEKTTECTQKNEEIRALTAEVGRLTAEISKYDTTDYEKIIADLKAEVQSLANDNARILQGELSARRELSSAKKTIKKLEAYIKNPTDESIEEVENENVDVPFETMLEAVKDKYIAICSFSFVDSIKARLEDYGFTNVTYYVDEKNVKMKGKCDIGVVITNRASHSLLRQLEHYIGGKSPILYFNGTNVERLITEIYEEVCDD